MTEYLSVTVGGLTRRLPIRQVAPGVSIAFLQLLGDVELCAAAAAALIAVSERPCDVVVAPELKGVVLAHEIARLVGRPYVVLRKHERSYMTGSTSVAVRSVTSSDEQRLWLSGDDAATLIGRRVWLVDDVVTTGSSLAAARSLVEAAGATVVEQLAVFTEGDEAGERTDLRALGHLPLFLAPPV